MLTTLKNAFKIKDIRKRLLFTLAMLVVIRFGCQLPVPGVNREYFQQPSLLRRQEMLLISLMHSQVGHF